MQCSHSCRQRLRDAFCRSDYTTERRWSYLLSPADGPFQIFGSRAGSEPAKALFQERQLLTLKWHGSKRHSVSDQHQQALVGPSGAGKSSILSLCERFHDPTSGEILFDVLDLRTHDVRDLRGKMSLLDQDSELLPGSISYNIGLGLSNRIANRDDIERAARECGVHDFIASLPNGCATDCVSSQLSGGQLQRIALARALIRDPDLLLLDEPTSALDAQSERRVYDALRAVAAQRTTIIVSHRLASIRHADQIIVLDQGSIVEQGTHDELMHNQALYASMAKTQGL